MSSICNDIRERNQVVMDVSRIETTRGMISDLIARGEWIRERARCKGEHSRGECQEFQLLQVFGTHRALF